MFRSKFSGVYEVGGTVGPLSLPSGSWRNVFFELSFDYGGYITEWRYYAERAGTFFADVWRPLGGGSYLLVSKHTVTASGSGISVKQKHIYT